MKFEYFLWKEESGEFFGSSVLKWIKSYQGDGHSDLNLSKVLII